MIFSRISVLGCRMRKSRIPRRLYKSLQIFELDSIEYERYVSLHCLSTFTTVAFYIYSKFNHKSQTRSNRITTFWNKFYCKILAIIYFHNSVVWCGKSHSIYSWVTFFNLFFITILNGKFSVLWNMSQTLYYKNYSKYVDTLKTAKLKNVWYFTTNAYIFIIK